MLVHHLPGCRGHRAQPRIRPACDDRRGTTDPASGHQVRSDRRARRVNANTEIDGDRDHGRGDQTILGTRDKEQQELLAGIWLYEIADLTNIKKTEVEHIKAFASRTCDRARPAYGHSRVDRPRRCILFATTNDDEYLKAADRRFWPVRTTIIDIEALRRDRDQLWAEAAQREREGASIVLDHSLWNAARVEQEAREESDPWDDMLADVVGTVEGGEERVSATDLLTLVLNIHVSKQRDLDFKRLGRCMRRLGWEGPKPTRIAGKVTKGYARLRNAGS